MCSVSRNGVRFLPARLEYNAHFSACQPNMEQFHDNQRSFHDEGNLFRIVKLSRNKNTQGNTVSCAARSRGHMESMDDSLPAESGFYFTY